MKKKKKKKNYKLQSIYLDLSIQAGQGQQIKHLKEEKKKKKKSSH
jgi:hypothetical protein